jgi:hypothetical protein
MIIRGHLATMPEAKEGKSGSTYYNLRVAENYGKDDRRTTVWFDVVASISEVEADLLPKGQAVQIDGKLDAEAYVSKKVLVGEAVPTTWDGVIALLKSKKALKTSLKLITNSRGVQAITFEKRADGSQQEGAAAPAAQNGHVPF